MLEPSEVRDWDAVGFAVAWKPPPGLLAQVRAARCARCAPCRAPASPHARQRGGQPPPAIGARACGHLKVHPAAAQCRNLRAAMSLGAGVDHILQPGQVPEGLPILRIVSGGAGGGGGGAVTRG